VQSTSWSTSTGPAPATDPPKRSTAASSISADPPSASVTPPPTSPVPYSKPAASVTPTASDLSYTLDADRRRLHRDALERGNGPGAVVHARGDLGPGVEALRAGQPVLPRAPEGRLDKDRGRAPVPGRSRRQLPPGSAATEMPVPQQRAAVVRRRRLHLPRPAGRALPPRELRDPDHAARRRRLVPGPRRTGRTVGRPGPRRRQRCFSRRDPAAMAGRSRGPAVRAARRAGHTPAGRQGGQRPVPGLCPDDAAAPGRPPDQPQAARRALPRLGGGGRRPAAAGLLAAGAPGTHAAWPPPRSPDLAG
jgi:hypothetical protein